MSILDDFVIDLLKKEIIQDYKAQVEIVREFYNNNYKKHTKVGFHNFKMELWAIWYILKWNKTEMYFDTKWINYFQKIQEEKSSQTRKYVTKTKCLLCNITFTDDNFMQEHLKWEYHKIRTQYVTEKNEFKNTNDIDLKITKMSKNLHSDTLKIEYPIQTDLNATLSIINNTKDYLNIMDFIIINPLVKDVSLDEDFDKGCLLGSQESVNMNLHAKFENSISFLYPIVIITEDPDDDRKYHLKEMEFEITSEVSYLKPESKYTETKPKVVETFKDMLDKIIPGQKPEFKSFYKEALHLRAFSIPRELNSVLKDLMTRYPQFTERSFLSMQLNSVFCKILNIYPEISESNYFSKMKTLLHIEENQIAIDIRDYDMVSTLKPIRGSTLYKLEVPGLAEQRPSLLIFDKVYIKEHKNNKIKYEGFVHKVEELTINLGLNKRFNDIFIENKKFHIEFGFNRRTMKVEKQALYLAETHEIIPSLFPSKTEVKLLSVTHPSLNFSNRYLNDEQKTAVENIIVPKNYPFIIFGPPGTGKTVTVVEAVYQVWKNYPKSKILICAPSNAAANEVAIRLIDIIPKSELFRLLGSVYAEVVGDGFHNLKPVTNIDGSGFFYMPAVEDLLKYRILITTIITAARLVNGGIPSGHFSHVFIDESGYATETQTLIPIAGILSSEKTKGKLTGQIILAGDPKQLGPRVHSRFAKYCGYGLSLLERLIKTCEAYTRDNIDSYDNRSVTKLIKNYRSHETILRVPNNLFYNGELEAVGNEFTELFIGWNSLKNNEFPVIFHHVEGEDTREKNSPSFFNVQEIEVVVEYLQKLLSSKVKGVQIRQNHIGVITPYRKQAEKIRKACADKKWKNLLVGSVEQFQGKERLVIVVSAVRSKNVNRFEEIDQKCELGFLKNPKRFNVAMTRAKALLIVIGNANVLKTDGNWLKFIEYCVENKSVEGKRFNLTDNNE